MDSDNEELLPSTPPELANITNNTVLHLLPVKSQELYNIAYKKFRDYQGNKKTKSFSENVILPYFVELSENYAPSTLWATYSMLRSTISLYHNIDISKYAKLIMFIKQRNKGYKPTKAKILTKEQCVQFIKNAPDEQYLTTKVALVFGIAGASRIEELAYLQVSEIEELDSKLLVHLNKTKNDKQRSFIVLEEYLELYRKYCENRPENFPTERFFYKYSNGKSYRQVVGKHTFAAMPKKIAEFLKLKEASKYTGHCFRRTSATLLVNAGANITTLKQHGGWNSDKVAEGYIEESITNKIEIAEKILNGTSSVSNRSKSSNNSKMLSVPCTSKASTTVSLTKNKTERSVSNSNKIENDLNCMEIFQNCTFNNSSIVINIVKDKN